MDRIKRFLIFLGLLSYGLVLSAQNTKPGLLAWWKLDKVIDGKVIDKVTGFQDELSGNYRLVKGIKGNALKFDGYTTLIKRLSSRAKKISGSFSIEAWIALAAYPWNFCPVVSHQGSDGGYSFEIGPEGELLFKIFDGQQWRELTSTEKVPLKEWAQTVAIYDRQHGISVFINGKEAGRLKFLSTFADSEKADILMGSLTEKKLPAFFNNISLPSWFSLDAILDEVKIYGSALKPEIISENFRANKPQTAPEIPSRLFPRGPDGPLRFAAYYMKLKYYWEWDDLWRVGEHPDIVVTFAQSPVRLIFWRGTRYSPCWVSESNIWMADQSVEAWNDEDGCFEHMQDRHCQYSQVRIIENTAARIVVHWRYALVSVRNRIWNTDERSGWGCWIDEYYYIYPDQTAIRKYTWKHNSLKEPHQFQESILLTAPGQLQGDLINKDYVTVANIKGEKQVFSFVENPSPETEKFIPRNPIIQRHNIRSEHKPFIIFEPGGSMQYLKDLNIENLSKPGKYSHWPVGQVLSDGRVQKTPDRETSFLGFPITDPVIHIGKDGRDWACSLYGMTNKSMDDLLYLAKSWVNSPKLKLISGDIRIDGYDMSQRAYIFEAEKNDSHQTIQVVMKADENHPVHNLCFYLKNWGGEDVSLYINKEKKIKGKDFSTGTIQTFGGEDLILWIPIFLTKPVSLQFERISGGK